MKTKYCKDSKADWRPGPLAMKWLPTNSPARWDKGRRSIGERRGWRRGRSWDQERLTHTKLRACDTHLVERGEIGAPTLPIPILPRERNNGVPECPAARSQMG
ncbi:unnamed protein product, partial [Ectocarpus fasciculatus]